MAIIDHRRALAQIRDQSVIHPTSTAAFSLVFKDLRVLYQSLNKGVLRLLENYFSTPKKNAAKILVLYKVYLVQTKKMTGVFNDAKDLLGQEPIELTTPPDSFQQSLEQYLENEDDERLPRVTHKSVPVVPLEDLIGDFGEMRVTKKAPEATMLGGGLDDLLSQVRGLGHGACWQFGGCAAHVRNIARSAADAVASGQPLHVPWRPRCASSLSACPCPLPGCGACEAAAGSRRRGSGGGVGG